ncbi:hypothetical protein QBC47DRAFT_84340 [Echria macrotheca]|uniref:Uncharacterized protein n=1 Tax=Echria macrotheca TaxID=438768 RepID=A0AAJ0B3X6_9PEZI|nr:hypothetical protein QBC47DRAFT_84340 [Echria macrotheca]
MLGRILLTIDSLLLLLGAPLADYNHTHIFNPRWPPHAKFHCGQTITISVLLGLATLFYTWQPVLAQTKSTSSSLSATQAAVARQSLHAAVFTGSVYWLGGLAAIQYPGALGTDPEFGTGFPQGKGFSVALGLGILGWALETFT